MSPLAQPPKTRARRAQRGAALPIVLVLIAGVALIMAAAYRSVASSTGLVRDLQARADAARALFSAEQQTTFAYLSGQPTPRGLYLDRGEPLDAQAAFFGELDFDVVDEAALWPATGATRKFAAGPAPVEVRYLDGGGFLSIARMTPEEMTALFMVMGLGREASEEAAAKISDYQDDDVVRRFRGAERADYRLRALPPPTNAPLRVFEELYSVYDLEAIAGPELLGALKAHLSFSPEYAPPRSAFMDDAFAPVLAASAQSELDRGSGIADLTPSPRARFVLTAYSGGDAHRRTVEIQRAANAAGKPFRRYLVSEGVDAGAPAPGAEEWDEHLSIFEPAAIDDDG